MNDINQQKYDPAAESSLAIDFPAVYHMLREKAWLIAVCVVVASSLAGVYITRTPKIYAAQTMVEVEQGERKVVNIQDIKMEDLSSLEELKTIEQNLDSSALLEGVVETLKLTPEQLGLPARPEKPYSDSELVDALEDMVSVHLVRGTRLIAVVAENHDPVLAQQISAEVVRQYILNTVSQRLAINQEANKFLIAEADRLKTKLGGSEQALQEYKEQNQAVSLEENQNITVAKLKELNMNLTAVKGERLKLESDYAQVQKLTGKDPSELMAIPSVASSLVVTEQEKAVAEVEGQMANLAKRYKPLHPKYIQAQGEVAAARARLSEAILKAAESVGTSLESTRETEKSFERALADQEQASLALSKIGIPYNVLLREVQSDQALYDSVLTRLKETDVTKGIEQDNIRLTEPARLPRNPIKPRKLLVLAGALLGGLAAGVALGFLLDAMDNTFKTVDQAEMHLDLPAVTAIPKSPSQPADHKGLLILDEPHGQVAEAFRTLRTSLSLLGKTSERTVFLFTSAVPSEGKSFCSMNYAVSLAQQGLRTLLIDADLRLPTVGKIFFDGKPHAGVSEAISGDVELGAAIQASEVPNLHIMTAGRRSPNPAELLAGSGFGDLVRAAMHQFDRIVIDSAPVNAVSDPLLLVKWSHIVCLVVHAGKTPRRAVMRACKLLAEAGSRPVGFILNRMPQNSGGGYYYHYHSSGDYGKVYGVARKNGKTAES